MRNHKYGIAILGCGGIAPSHARAYRNFANDCDLIAVSDVSEQAAQRFLSEYGASHWYADWRDLLTDERIDVVSICTPHYLHAPMTIAAACAGKHILCEKPMAMNVGEAHEMIEACRQHNVKLSIGSERFNPRHRFLKEMVLPELGAIEFSSLLSFYFRTNAYYQAGAWRGTWAGEGGGVCVNQAIYVWDQWQWFLSGVDYAYGYWANLMHPTIEVEDIAYGLVEFKNGSYGKFLATTCCDWQPDRQSLLIQGQHGSIWAKDAWLYDIDFALRDAKLEAALRSQFEQVIDPTYHGEFHSWQVADLFAAIREDRLPLVPEAMDALKILNGVHWHGWHHADKFNSWAQQFHLPLTVEEAQAQGWAGGALMETLTTIVKTPTRSLEVPFLHKKVA